MKFHGYCTLLSPEAMKLPYLEALQSWSRLCETISICYSRFPDLGFPVPAGAIAPWVPDNSLEILQKFDKEVLGGKLRIVEHTWNPDEPREDGFTKQIARVCASVGLDKEDWLVQFDADEILRDNDELRFMETADGDNKLPFGQRRPFMITGILELFGNANQVRFGFGNWIKIRATRNIPELQHGMPLRLGEMAVRGRNPRTGKIVAIDNRDDGAGFINSLSLTRPNDRDGIWMFNPNVIQAARQAQQILAQNPQVITQVTAMLQADMNAGGIWMYHTSWVDIARKWRMGWFFDNFWSVLSGKQDHFVDKAALKGEFTHTHAPEGDELQAELIRELSRIEIQPIKVEQPSVFEAVQNWRQVALAAVSA